MADFGTTFYNNLKKNVTQEFSVPKELVGVGAGAFVTLSNALITVVGGTIGAPKWVMLGRELEAIGVSYAAGAEDADFSGIVSVGSNLFISTIVTGAILGTAAAGTVTFGAAALAGFTGFALGTMTGILVDTAIDTVNEVYPNWPGNIRDEIKDAVNAIGDNIGNISDYISGHLDDISDEVAEFIKEQHPSEWMEAIEQLVEQSLRPNRDPLILDLGAQGIKLTSMADSGVYFDMDSDGAKERTGWITKEDGFLAIDANGNGKIDNVGELIGDPGRSGFAELKTYDSNNDGEINSSDAIWSQLRIWRDLNENGVTEKGELQTLAANKVASLNTNFTTVNFTASENLIHEQGSYEMVGGTRRQMIDAWLQTDSVNTQPSVATTISAEAASLPEMRGYGTLSNLQSAMSKDAGLLKLVEAFVGLKPTEFSKAEAMVEAILMEWAGVEKLAPDSRGGAVDARKLAVLEAITGTPWVQLGSVPPVTNPPEWAAVNLERAYDILLEEFTARFLIVGPLKGALGDVLYSASADQVLGLQPFENYVAAIDALSPTDAQLGVLFWAESIKALRSLGEGNGTDSSTVDQHIQDALSKYGLDDFLSSLGEVVDLRKAAAGARSFGDRETVLLGNGADNVTLTGSGAAVFSGGGDDVIRSKAYSAVTLSGGAGNDALFGGDQGDFLDGGTGSDWMEGGAGDDTYIVDSLGDVVKEMDPSSYNPGNDTIRASISVTLQEGIENLALTGGKAIDGTGNSAANMLTGNSAKNVLRGLGGDDLYEIGIEDTVVEKSGQGEDTVRVAGSYALTANVEDLVLLGSGNFKATGNSLDNDIAGNAGNNVINGGAGGDRMVGGDGNDTYYVDHVYDQVTEYVGAGIDTIYSSVTINYAYNIEKIILTGTADINASGMADADTLIGNAGSNTLDGREGNDNMSGGAGDDIYVVDSLKDKVTEKAGEGDDTVWTSLNSFTLQSNVEKLDAAAHSDAFTGKGNDGDNTIVGGYGADKLYGAAGDDTLLGGYGDVKDILYGEGGNDTLDGGQGADTMVGGDGDDSYEIDDAGDKVVEAANGGIDTIRVKTSIFTLAANIENVIIADGGQWDVNGNAADNVITGNAYSNVLDGQGGSDTMAGGQGDDTYLVDVVGDRVMEFAGSGRDHIKSYVSLNLSDNLEDLTLLGSKAIYAAGNELDNVIVGNSAANYIVGGAGSDDMTGGSGRDTFMLLSDDGAIDRITDFKIGASGDKLDVTKLLKSIGYTGKTPFADDVLRVDPSPYGDGAAWLQLNTGWKANVADVWQTIVTLDNVDAAKLEGQISVIGTTNAAPFVNSAVSEILVAPGEQLQLLVENMAADYDSPTLSWSATALDATGAAVAMPSWLIFNAGVPALYSVPTTSANDISVRFTAKDENGLSTSFTTTVDVRRADLGDQVFTGTDESNVIKPGAGDDIVNALGGNDQILLSATLTKGEKTDGDDHFDGGSGRDTLDFSAVKSAVKVDLLEGTAKGVTVGLDTVSAIEVVIGTAFNDVFVGSSLSDTFDGGNGKDIFSFASKLGKENVDTIRNFSAVDDTFHLDGGIFSSLTPGALLSKTFKDLATGTIDADDRILYNSKTGVLSYDVDGSGKVAALQFAVLEDGPTLNYNDFLVV